MARWHSSFKDVDFLVSADTQDAAGSSQPPQFVVTSSSSRLHMDLILAEICKLRMETIVICQGQKEMLQMSRRQSRRVDQIASRVDMLLDYSTEVNSTLANMFNASGFNTGPDPFHFPTPSVFLEYILDIKEEEDDDMADDV